MCCGDARRPMAFASYGGPQDAIKWPGDALAHQGSSWRVDDDDYRQKRARFRRFWRGAAEGIDGFPAIEDELVQFLWLRCSTRWGGALGTRGQASDGLSGRRGDLTGARVSRAFAEMSEGEREGEALGFSGGRRSSYRHQGRRRSSGPSGLQRWIGCLSELHRAASISRRKTMTKGYAGPAGVGLHQLGFV
jgi:hypothetical protein